MSVAEKVKKCVKSVKSGVKDGGKSQSTIRWERSKECRVLAGRNPAVVAVGAWIESGYVVQEQPELLAMLTEQKREEKRREKEQSQRRFQDSLCQRLSHQAHLRRTMQLQKSYEMAARERQAVQQTSEAAQRLTPQKSLFSPWPRSNLAVCSPEAQLVLTKEDHEDLHEHQISRVLRQVRQRLASYQTAPDGDALCELPGGLWKTTPRGKPASRLVEEEEDEENKEGSESEEDGEIPPAGQRDQMFHLRTQSIKTVTFRNGEFDRMCPVASREPDFRGPNSHFSRVLWPEEDHEELRRQKQSQFLLHRRLFMDIEREQVKENQWHRKHLSRIARIKADKERQRQEEERRMAREERARERAERERLVLERLRLEEEEQALEEKNRQREKKAKEVARYVEALRAQMKEKLRQEKVELPALCCCGEGFWDSHPDTCANNCVFYRNPKAYAQVLHSVLRSCGLNDPDPRTPARKTSPVHAGDPAPTPT